MRVSSEQTPTLDMWQFAPEPSVALIASVIPSNKPTFGMTAGLPVTLKGLVGGKGKVVGMEHFGYSAPYKVLDEKFGYTADNVYNQVLSYLDEYE